MLSRHSLSVIGRYGSGSLHGRTAAPFKQRINHYRRAQWSVGLFGGLHLLVSCARLYFFLLGKTLILAVGICSLDDSIQERRTRLLKPFRAPKTDIGRKAALLVSTAFLIRTLSHMCAVETDLVHYGR